MSAGQARRRERTKVRAPRRPTWDCVNNCGRRAAAWDPKNAICGPCRLAMPVVEYTRPPTDDVDLADIPF